MALASLAEGLMEICSRVEIIDGGVNVWVSDGLQRYPDDTVWLDKRMGREDLSGAHLEQMYSWGPNFEYHGNLDAVRLWFTHQRQQEGE